MKLKSAAGLVYYVRDVGESVAFYEQLGVVFKRKEDDRATGYINWFWIEFLPGGARSKPGKSGAAPPLYLSVDDVDAAYKECRNKGIQIDGQPVDTALGNREFTLIDPDGYRVVIFKRK